MAKQMGVPIGKLCAGVNINGAQRLNHVQYLPKILSKNSMVCFLCHLSECIDITNRVIKSGEFYKKKIKKTLSDAINIEVVSICFKRLYFL